MKESLVALRQLLISDEKLPKSVEPGVCGFHDPTTVLRRPPAPPLLSCDPRSVPVETNLVTNRLTVISLIRIQEGMRSLRAGNDDCIEHGSELSDVMSMGPVTESDSGTPRASTRRWRLLPFFPPICRVWAGCFLTKGRLDHGPVYALPLPGNPFHLVVLKQGRNARGRGRTRP